MNEPLDISALRDLLEYSPETGELRWKPRGKRDFDTQFAGKPALICPDKDGYLKGTVKFRYVKAHRVAWAIYHGEWPEIVDHINGNITDNRISNLRSVDSAESSRNKPRMRSNKSGVVGVCWSTQDKRWLASIRVNGRLICLGYFREFDAAVTARKAGEREYGYHENHGREARSSAA